MELEVTKIRLPSGKEVGIIEALSFCYDISDTDFQVLKVLLNSEGKNEDSLAEMLKLSKASINRSVNKLVSLGFVERVKDSSSKGGRPRYIYKAIPTERLIEKIVNDFKRCAELFGQLIPKELGKQQQ
ncbi:MULTISPECIES: HTH-type transcriptional regulator Lrs14 [Sulfolobaceae]|uniref:MarR family transcriptional regulator n=1 Tax=Sulfurisphaera ohwakuensis TaxID=69656 RepID=A0A650CI85_SULOH|nr:MULTISPECIES: HTH-type transcriptional regulator Lrs14 [Sulfolobaceae]MBB5253740.1 putative transcriptional regulator [Sulfurisphaera ohwakuensis]QGR17571.1 MarR family transcriptional regulator [Sulfurisphaera ohwakuensis]QIW24777.1 MarR family transcriptional regulator [Sulfolobus sp. S-194]